MNVLGVTPVYLYRLFIFWDVIYSFASLFCDHLLR